MEGVQLQDGGICPRERRVLLCAKVCVALMSVCVCFFFFFF